MPLPNPCFHRAVQFAREQMTPKLLYFSCNKSVRSSSASDPRGDGLNPLWSAQPRDRDGSDAAVGAILPSALVATKDGVLFIANDYPGGQTGAVRQRI
jgi:hypothetical protein